MINIMELQSKTPTMMNNSHYKYYLIINGKMTNDHQQLMINLPSYLYGTLIISDKKAQFDNKFNSQFIHAKLIDLQTALKLIKNKQIVLNDYWKSLWPSIKLFTNDDAAAQEKLQNYDSNDEVLTI